VAVGVGVGAVCSVAASAGVGVAVGVGVAPGSGAPPQAARKITILTIDNFTHPWHILNFISVLLSFSIEILGIYLLLAAESVIETMHDKKIAWRAPLCRGISPRLFTCNSPLFFGQIPRKRVICQFGPIRIPPFVLSFTYKITIQYFILRFK
jgi:hypothetical protein